MSYAFDWGFLLIAPFWALMLLAPRWHVTRRIIASPWIAVGPAVLYLVLVLPVISMVLPVVATPTLAGVTALLGTPLGATLSWQHFLAFDLLVARMIYLDAEPRGIPVWLLAPILLLTLLLGPLGYLCYLAYRSVSTTLRPAHAAAGADVRGPGV